MGDEGLSPAAGQQHQFRPLIITEVTESVSLLLLAYGRVHRMSARCMLNLETDGVWLALRGARQCRGHAYWNRPDVALSWQRHTCFRV